MFLLYELSVLLARIFEGRRKRAEQAEQDEDDDDEAGATADA
jgi:Sec-independent protein secretion pathway component TatC